MRAAGEISAAELKAARERILGEAAATVEPLGLEEPFYLAPPKAAPKRKRTSAGRVFLGLVVLVGILAFIGSLAGNGSTGTSASSSAANPGTPAGASASAPRPAPSSDNSAATEAACKLDLQCMGDKATPIASVQCAPLIEKFAKHDVKWTNGFMDFGYSRLRWKNEKLGIVTMIGDKVEFQNGFGAWTPMTYECDVDVANNRITDMNVFEGRLP